MKRVTAFVGSAHRKNTLRAVQQFLGNLQALGALETEVVILTDYRLGVCRGCRLCFEKGESFCPLKDDRDVLLRKIDASDGVIFATPNYTFQMSGVMKVFLDRFGFLCHRPRFFGKAFTSIVAQGFGGGDKIVDYFDFTASILGFNTVKGVTVTGFDPLTGNEQHKIDRALSRLSRRFFAVLDRPAAAEPTLYQIFLFRMGRTTIKQKANVESIDYQYYDSRGWLEADYYYPTHLNPVKKAAGGLFDVAAAAVRSMM